MLRSWGISESELASFVEGPCPPDIMGINHYLTSDRFLDEDQTTYPESRYAPENTGEHPPCADVGVWHLANQGAVTWEALARMAASAAQIESGVIEGRPICTLGLAARRPLFSALGSDRAWLMPKLETALASFARERAAPGALLAPR